MARRQFNRGAVTARRKRIWARQPFLLSGIVNDTGPQQLDLMGALKLSGAGVSPLGWTCGPVFLSGLQVRRTASASVNSTVVLGVRVGSNLIEAIDHDPSDLPMLDWMLWGAFAAPDGVGAQFYGGDPPASSQSMRKLEEVNDNLWLVAGTHAITGTFEVSGWSSVLVILP